MSESKRLLYRLAELMLEAGSNELSVDSLFDDPEIGDSVRSIQIDSPYQQMQLQGVLTESVKENELKVRFTFEGYFSFVLATIIQKKFNESFFEALMSRVDLDWIRKALEIFLLSDLKNGNFEVFNLLIRSQNKEILVFPLANYFEIYSTEIQNFDNHHLRQKRSFFDIYIAYFSSEHYDLIFKSILLLETLNKSFVCETIVRKLFEIKEEYSYDSIDFYTKIIRFIKRSSEQLKEFTEIINWIDGKDPDRRFMLDINSRLFNVYLNNSMLIEGREIIKKCLKYEIEFFGKSHVFVANSYKDLGLIELKLTNGIVAKKFFKRSLKILIQNSESQKEKLILYFNLAVAEMHNRNFKESIRIFKNILKIRVKEYGYYSINVSKVLGYLGIAIIENSEKNTVNGISLILRAYKINKMIFKDINYHNTNFRPYMSRYFFDKDDFKRSEYLLKKNLQHRVILLGKDSLEVSYSYSDLDHYYSAIEDWGKAVIYCKKALKLYEKHELFQEAIILKTLEDLAFYHYELKDLLNSKIYLEKALNLISKEAVLSDEYMRIQENYAFILFELEDFDASLKELHLFLEYEKKSDVYFLMSACYELLDDCCNSRIYSDLVSELTDVKIFNSFIYLSNSYFEKENYSKSLKYLKLAIKSFFLARVKDFSILSQIYYRIAQCYYLLNNKDKSIYFYLKSFFLDKKGGTVQVVGTILEEQGILDKALNFFLLAASVRLDRTGVFSKETKESVGSCKRIANMLNVYGDLPIWIKEFSS